MNPFDLVVVAAACAAVVLGFRAGLLRSLTTILGYLAAAPVAVAVTPGLTTLAVGGEHASPNATSLVLCITFIALGAGVTTLLRAAIVEFVGADISIADRVAGAALGFARTGLVAVLVVLVFDRVIPPDREPGFLSGSVLRPYLSAAAQTGLQSLPPDFDNYIERLKREQGI